MSLEGVVRLLPDGNGGFDVAQPGDPLGGYYLVHPNAVMPGETIVRSKCANFENVSHLLRWCKFTFDGEVTDSHGQVIGRLTKSQVLDVLPRLDPPRPTLKVEGRRDVFNNPANYRIAKPYPLEKKIDLIVSRLPKNISRNKFTSTALQVGPTAKTPRVPYSSKVARNLRNVHKGQYKLYFSECDLINQLDLSKKILFIYPGGGPGHHVGLMAARHPNIFFVLIDPVFVKPDITPTANIFIIPTLFDPEPFRGYSDLGRDDWDVVLVSDIRSDPKGPDGRHFSSQEKRTKEYSDAFEREVATNMEWQKQWVLDVRPSMAMLKFRLNFHVRGKTRYLAGERHYQVWARNESAELRLLVTRDANGGYPEVDYDNQTYEEQMFWFNSVYRPARLKSPYQSYDLARSAEILSEYLGEHGKPASDAKVVAFLLLVDDYFVREHKRQDADFARTFGL